MARRRRRDQEFITLSKALWSHTLPHLKLLALTNNRIGSRGVEYFAEGLSDDHLPALKILRLEDNQVGGKGVRALTRACAKGALPCCTKIQLDGNHADITAASDTLHRELRRRWLRATELARKWLSWNTDLNFDGVGAGAPQINILAEALLHAHASHDLPRVFTVDLANNWIGCEVSVPPKGSGPSCTRDRYTSTLPC